MPILSPTFWEYFVRYGKTRKSGSTGVMTKRLPSKKKNKQQLKTKHNKWVSKCLVSMKKKELFMGMRSMLKSMISVKEDKKVVIASLVLNYQLYAYVLFYFIIREVWLLQSLTCLFINTFLYRVLYKPWSGFFGKFQDLKDLFPTVREQKLLFHTWKWAEYWKCLSFNNKPKLQCKSYKIAFYKILN